MRRVTVVVTGPSAPAGGAGSELIAHRLCGGDPVEMLQVHLVSRPRSARPPVLPYRVTSQAEGLLDSAKAARPHRGMRSTQVNRCSFGLEHRREGPRLVGGAARWPPRDAGCHPRLACAA